MALTPGTSLNLGNFIGDNGEIVLPGLNDPGYWFMRNGQFEPYIPSSGGAPPVSQGDYGFPSGGSVSTSSMVARAGITPQGSPTDVAFGMELQQQMFQNLLSANADRRASVDQTVSIINLLSELERVSPTRAASFAAAMGMGDGPDLGFTNDIGQGAMARVSGKAGNQNISLPLSLSGKNLDFLGNNPNVANVVQDVASAIGLPDIFRRSAASAIPTSRSLLSMAG